MPGGDDNRSRINRAVVAMLAAARAEAAMNNFLNPPITQQQIDQMQAARFDPALAAWLRTHPPVPDVAPYQTPNVYTGTVVPTHPRTPTENFLASMNLYPFPARPLSEPSPGSRVSQGERVVIGLAIVGAFHMAASNPGVGGAAPGPFTALGALPRTPAQNQAAAAAIQRAAAVRQAALGRALLAEPGYQGTTWLGMRNEALTGGSSLAFPRDSLSQAQRGLQLGVLESETEVAASYWRSVDRWTAAFNNAGRDIPPELLAPNPPPRPPPGTPLPPELTGPIAPIDLLAPPRARGGPFMSVDPAVSDLDDDGWGELSQSNQIPEKDVAAYTPGGGSGGGSGGTVPV